jgi:hypothetical protein
MRTHLASLIVLLASACSPIVADTNGEGDLDSDVVDDMDSDSEPAPDVDTGTEPDETEPSAADWSGSWSAYVFLEAEGDFGGGQDITCEGEMSFEFDDSGDVEGEGICSVGGWAEAELSFEGEVDADGELSGLMLFSQSWIGSAELDVSGAASDGSVIESDVDGIMSVGGYDVPLFGDMTLERM